jgi:hypothetical protein
MREYRSEKDCADVFGEPERNTVTTRSNPMYATDDRDPCAYIPLLVFVRLNDARALYALPFGPTVATYLIVPMRA